MRADVKTVVADVNKPDVTSEAYPIAPYGRTNR